MSIFINPTFLMGSGAGLLLAFLIQGLFDLVNISSNVPLLEEQSSRIATTRNLKILQSHPKCGVTSGGREECWWNCSKEITDGNSIFFEVVLMIVQHEKT